MVAQAVAAIALGLLGMAGVAKVVDPDPTSGALEAARLPSGRPLARALGAVEILVALFGLALGGAVVALAAVFYLGFTLFTLSGVLEQRPIQSCGCFGRDDTPPSWLHVVYNAMATVMLGWVALASSPAIPWNGPLVEVFAYLAFVAIGVYASYLVLSVLPQTLTLTRSR